MRAMFIGVLAIVVVACAGSASPSPSSAPSVGSSEAPRSPSSTTDAVRVEVTLTDTFRIEPATIAVPAGATVTFVVTNAGVLEHEFFVGDEAAQAEHEQEMIANGGMMHDHSNAISVAPGATKELTMTFEAAADLLAGCHVAGHYAAGMKAAIEVGG